MDISLAHKFAIHNFQTATIFQSRNKKGPRTTPEKDIENVFNPAVAKLDALRFPNNGMPGVLMERRNMRIRQRLFFRPVVKILSAISMYRDRIAEPSLIQPIRWFQMTGRDVH